MTVTAVLDESDMTYVVRSPFEAKEAIKSLPYYARKWDAGAKAWRVDAGFIGHLRLALRAEGFHLLVTENPSTLPPAAAVDWVAEAFKACPVSNRDTLRRGLMRAFHPDAGGSEEIAKRINRQADA